MCSFVKKKYFCKNLKETYERRIELGKESRACVEIRMDFYAF